jgi:acyl carrier protein
MMLLRSDVGQIIEKVREYVIKRILVGVTDGNLRDTDSFLEKGILNSTGVLELVSFIEEQFGFHCLDEEITPENLDSLTSIAIFVQKKMSRVDSEVRPEVQS